jgi:hypothetical protein
MNGNASQSTGGMDSKSSDLYFTRVVVPTTDAHFGQLDYLTEAVPSRVGARSAASFVGAYGSVGSDITHHVRLSHR